MATSESEEDYQSADEDIDFEDNALSTDTKPNVAVERTTVPVNAENKTSLTAEENGTDNYENTVEDTSKTVKTGDGGTGSCVTDTGNTSLKELINLKIDKDVTSKVEEAVSVKDEYKETEGKSESDQGLSQKGIEIDAEKCVLEEGHTISLEILNPSTEDVGANGKQRQGRRQKQPREQKPKTSGVKKLGVKMEASSAQQNLNSKMVTPAITESSERTERGFGVPPRRVECWEENVNAPVQAAATEERSAPSSTVTESSEKTEQGFGVPPRRVQCWEEGVNSPVRSAAPEEKSAPSSRNCHKEPQSKMPENELEKIDSVLDRIASHTNNSSSKGSWGGWSGWGVSSLLSTATESVSTLTSQVSHGLSSVLETGLGVPNPEELARMDLQKTVHRDDEDEPRKDEGPETHAQKQDEEPSLFNLGLVMTGVTSIGKLVETAGTKVLTGGLDTLETVGKKTMEVLQDGDPGLKKKRAFFTGEKLVLSQVLQEAKERAEFENREKQDREALRQAHFETLFDDFQGLVHLEALEMLSKKCEMKLEGELFLSSGEELVELQDKVDELKKKCTLPEEDDDDEEDGVEEFGWQEELLSSARQLEVQDSLDKMIKSWREIEGWLDSDQGELSCREIHVKTMSTLAQLTAEAVKHFHKSAELIAVKTDRNPLQEAEVFRSEALHVSRQLRRLAERFSKLLDSFAENNTGSTSVNELITSIFLEASNSSSYIRQAFQLMIPVIQVGVIM